MRRGHLLIVLALIILPMGISAQEDGESGGSDTLGFGMDIGLGTVSIIDPDTGLPENWNNISLRPDIALGKFGIGLAVDLNFAFNNEDGTAGFRVREEDWIPSDDYNFLELYLPMFRYIRYGYKGEPLYGKIGAIDDFRLGNGFIIANYANTRFLPEQRISGLAFDLDGNLFGFPYIGLETVVGNLAKWDILGGRIYTRPIYWTGVPVFKELQLGFTAVGDRDPYYYEAKKDASVFASFVNDVAPVLVWGVDVKLPVLATQAASLAVFGDVVNQNNNYGGMLGFGGQLLSFISYGAQLRLLGDNFLPSYFNAGYDLFRMEQWSVYSGQVTIPGYTGWLASLGFDALESQLVFNATLEGPFNAPAGAESALPTLTGNFYIDRNLLGGFSFDALYQKKYISSFADLIDAENALISAKIGYSAGPATISMIYDLKYSPTVAANEPDWVITSKLETSISLTQ
jgi:hypothetical protein